jgi:hypothetical protein
VEEPPSPTFQRYFVFKNGSTKSFFFVRKKFGQKLKNLEIFAKIDDFSKKFCQTHFVYYTNTALKTSKDAIPGS